jgi:hypothetical protein
LPADLDRYKALKGGQNDSESSDRCFKNTQKRVVGERILNE